MSCYGLVLVFYFAIYDVSNSLFSLIFFSKLKLEDWAVKIDDACEVKEELSIIL